MVGVVALVVPTVDDEVAKPFRPYIDAARAQLALAGRRRVQPRAVHPVTDPVVLPGEIVESFGDIAGEHLRLEGRDRDFRPLEQEPCGPLARREVMLEDELVVHRRPQVGVEVGHLRSDHLARHGIAHQDVVHGHVGTEHPPHLTERHHDRLRRTGSRKLVDDGDHGAFGRA